MGWLQTLLHNLADVHGATIRSHRWGHSFEDSQKLAWTMHVTEVCTCRPVLPWRAATCLHQSVYIHADLQVLSNVVQPQFCREVFARLLAGEVEWKDGASRHKFSLGKGKDGASRGKIILGKGKYVARRGKLGLMDLPEEVVGMWLCCQGPTLDLSQLRCLESTQLVKLLHCMAVASPTVTALRMHGPVDTPSDRDGYAIDQDKIVRRIQPVLQAMLLACVSLKGLKVLDFTQMTLHVGHVPVLASIFERLSGSLEQLGISGFGFPQASGGHSDAPQDYEVQGTQMFFNAVAKLQKLQTLKMPGWGDFVQGEWMEDEDDVEVCKEKIRQAVSPLLGMPNLREVQVPKVDDTLPFTAEPHLKFKIAPFKPCS